MDTLYAYPAQFETMTTAHLELSLGATVTLEVFSGFGAQVETLYDHVFLPAGAHSAIFNADTFPDGLYILLLDYGGDTLRIIKAFKGTTVGTQESQQNKDEPFFFPNPNGGLLQATILGEKHIKITDIQGKEWRTILTDADVISLEDLSDGAYILSVFDNDGALIASERLLLKK